jgi:hypothetical protein
LSRLGSKGHITSAVALVVATAMTAMTLLLTGGSPATSAAPGAGAGAAGGTFTRVAHSPQGFAKSAISGQTKSGQRVTGYFTPTSISKHNGHLRMRGLVSGVVHKASGGTRTFSAVRTFKVKSMNGSRPGAATGAAGAAAAAGSCRILHLVLAPLNLDLLGLKVHLDQVLLNVVAQSGSGQLLGNLLCAVAHLLDNGGTLSQLLNKLEGILNQLLLGL